MKPVPYPFKPIYLLLLQALSFGALAQESAGPASVQSAFGQGQTRQVQNITRYDLNKALPGTNPLKTLERQSGVLFESADPWGNYEWSTFFSIRGFTQNQMGFTLDGVPLGDMSYRNNNGLHISRAISAENITRASVSQGAGAVGTASTSNLGGTVQFFSSDPSGSFGVTAAETLGSNSASRTFARVDTGMLGSGTKAYLSVTRHRADKWKGSGSQDADQVNVKVVQTLGAHKLTAFVNHSERMETDYQDMSLEMTSRLGWDWDNYSPDWQRAVDAARGIFRGNVKTMDDAYYVGRSLRRDDLAGATLNLMLGRSVALKATAYHHDNKAQGQWYTPYRASSSTVPISNRTFDYNLRRNGALGELTWDFGDHTIEGGFWVERNHQPVMLSFQAVTGPEQTEHFLRNPFAVQVQQEFTTRTRQFYLQDTVALLDDAMTLNIGFKSPTVTIDAVSLAGARAGGSLESSKTFLPQAGVRYELDNHNEVFSSLSKNMRAFQPGADGPFQATQAAFDASQPQLKPETSTSFDLGYRFTRGPVSGSVTAYRVLFKDRLTKVEACTGISGCPPSFVNVGEVQTTGIEAAAVWTLTPRWLWFNSVTYNKSAYQSDYISGNSNVPVSGKQVVNTPKTMFNSELTYDNRTWFGRAHLKYTDKRYFTYTNDGAVPEYWILNLSAGWHMPMKGVLKDLSLQLNVVNALDKLYYASVGTNGFLASDPTGANNPNLLTGSPRQVFATISGKF